MSWSAPAFWERRGPLAYALWPLGRLYNAILQARRRLTTPYKAPIPVICVGNVVLGGSGKTPLVRALRRLALENGLARRPAVLLRGYGGRLKGPVLVDISAHTARDVGDEALLHALDGPTIVARNRADGARWAAESGYDLLLLDDGLQNPTLAKDLTFLSWSGWPHGGNRFIFPAGPLREDIVKSLEYKDACFLYDTLYAPTALEAPNFEWVKEPAAPLPPGRYYAFCGIATPESFIETAQAMPGVELAGGRFFADHHAYTEKELEALTRQAGELGAQLLTTAKDYVRLPPAWRGRIARLDIEARFLQHDALVQYLTDSLADSLAPPR